MVERNALTLEWIQLADSDIEMAKRAMAGKRKLPDHAAFHYQQAAEKLLKGFLTWHGKPIEKTHDLGVLCTRCTEIDRTFEDLADDLESLTDYAVDFRYPGVSRPDENMVRNAADIVAQVDGRVMSRLPHELANARIGD